MSAFQGDSIFWVEVAKVNPNPYQPRKEFDENKLADLAESIRQYGVLQPLVVTRKEKEKESGGIAVEYELIAGERRLRAARMAHLFQVPVIIRDAEENDRMKLELAIIENLQREDLNAIDRAKAFQRLVDEFGFKHSQVAKKVGKSREYVSNSLRVLAMPEEIQQAVIDGSISEGHTRPLMMLNDKADEQLTVFKEVVYKKLTVRETEKIARRIAQDKIRKRKSEFDPKLTEYEKNFTESLGTRVQIEPRENGGKLVIDYFSDEDLQRFLSLFTTHYEPQVPPYERDDNANTDFLTRLNQQNTQALEQSQDGQSAEESQVQESQSEHEQTQPDEYQSQSHEYSTEDSTHAAEAEDGGSGDLREDRQEHSGSDAHEREESSTPSVEEDTPKPQSEPQTQEEEDLYSVRNFSI